MVRFYHLIFFNNGLHNQVINFLVITNKLITLLCNLKISIYSTIENKEIVS